MLIDVLLARETRATVREFQRCVVETTDAWEIEDITIANALAVSASTIRRWKSGRAVPHPVMRRAAIAALAKMRPA